MGDMFYLFAGFSYMICVYGVFVLDDDVYVVVNNWKVRGKLNYISEII